MALDQLAEHFARHAAISTSVDLSQYGVPFFSYWVFTKQNIPPSGPVPAATNLTAFFETKWTLEFNK